MRSVRRASGLVQTPQWLRLCRVTAMRSSPNHGETSGWTAEHSVMPEGRPHGSRSGRPIQPTVTPPRVAVERRSAPTHAPPLPRAPSGLDGREPNEINKIGVRLWTDRSTKTVKSVAATRSMAYRLTKGGGFVGDVRFFDRGGGRQGAQSVFLDQPAVTLDEVDEQIEGFRGKRQGRSVS